MTDDVTVEKVINSTFHYFPRNNSYALPGLYDIPTEDATFLIAVALIIFQMQTGSALIEAGMASAKNSVSVMIRKLADACIAGVGFWIFGFGLMFGRGEYTTPFFGAGDFFVNTKFGDALTSQVFTLYFYQMSYSTTSNSIISGTLNERGKFSSSCLLTFMAIALYSIGGGWVWAEHGWLRNIGVVDLSGGVIHLVGGAAGIMCTWFIGPRLGRYKNGTDPLPMGNQMYSLIGIFISWWGWLGFNVGCPYGVTGGKWHYAARAGVGTALATWGAGTASIFFSMYKNKGRVQVNEICTAIISALIMANASCFLKPTYLDVLYGAFTAVVTISAMPLMDKLGIDDATGVFSTHWLGGVLGYLSVGLFAENPVPLSTTSGRAGLLMGGGWWLFCVQLIAILSLSCLGFFGVYPILKLTDTLIPMRLDPISEELGCDIVEHGIGANKPLLPVTVNQSSDPIKNDETNLSAPVAQFSLKNIKPGDGSLRARNLAQFNLAFEGDTNISPRSVSNAPKFTFHI